MNATIAALLQDRISGLSYIDKVGGLVRPITRERWDAGNKPQKITIPVSIDVIDPLACTASTLLDLVPDQRYRAIVYFEDRGWRPVHDRLKGTFYASALRLVCWMNTAKMNGDSAAGDRVAQDIIASIAGSPYNDGAYLGIRHKVIGAAVKGPSLFSAYTYPEAVRQYLMPPFDAFGLDIATEFRMNPNCGDTIDPSDVNCWTPPTTKRRRNPNEFTCDELNDPITGLTAEQKACLT